MKSGAFVAVLILSIFATFAYGSRCTPIAPSKKVSAESIGANADVVYTNVHKVRTVQGVVMTLDYEPISNGVVDVYKVHSITKDASAAVRDSERLASYEVNVEGKFCLEGLDDGIYVLRIGTTEFLFQHAYIWVEKRRNFRNKKITIRLEPGF